MKLRKRDAGANYKRDRLFQSNGVHFQRTTTVEGYMYLRPEGCPHGTHTDRTAYTRGTHSREHGYTGRASGATP